MKPHIRFPLLAGAALVIGTGVALAQMEPPPPSPDMYGRGSMHERLSKRFERDFDLNKDGKITKAEFDKALSQRFAEAAGGGAAMTEAQFAKAHEKRLGDHTRRLFRRADWNGDGVLSLAEFRAPLRARFTRADRDGTGSVSCRRPSRHGRGDGPKRHSRRHRHHHHAGHFRRGRAKMCHDADLNKDGRVTRAELDKAIADKYAATVKGAKGMTGAQFYELARVRFQEMEAHRFKRLDRNHDGRLSEAEFAAPGARLFARLDQNKDGVVTKDELKARHHRHHGRWNRKPR
jgi:Ca2+-binding EF-hand superfamily protein